MPGTHTADPRSAFFDERASTWEERCYPQQARERLALLVPCFGVRKGDVVLDMGTGTGILAPYLRNAAAEQGTLISFDVSFEMVRHAAKKDAYTRGLVMQATAMRIPVKDEAVNTVVCFAAFPHFSDKSAALREMYRVLRPGGQVSVAHLLSRAELSQHHGGHPAVADDALPDNAVMTTMFLDAGFPAPQIIDIPGRYLATCHKE